jgi:putative endonuclease
MKPKLPSPLYRQKLGKFGEDKAAVYLQKHGYRIVARNFKARYGEIDIICTKDNTLIFVEVKTRIGDRFGAPEESVTPRKLREVIRTAQYFKLKYPGYPDAMRIDVIAIKLDESGEIASFNHLINVTS